MSKLLAVDPTDADPSKPKILIFGGSGVGKTWITLDFPNCYYIDPESGADLPHYQAKLKASGGKYVGKKQGALDPKTVLEQVQALATETHPYKTLAIDSISKLWNTIISQEAERLGDKDQYGASKKPAVAWIRSLIRWIDRIDMNVILIAHEKEQFADGKSIGKAADVWDKLPYELHLNLEVQKRGASRVSVVRKTRLTGFPDGATFDWSYPAFAERYGKDIIEAKGKAIVLASPEQINQLFNLIQQKGLKEEQIKGILAKAKVEAFEELDSATATSIITALNKKDK